MFSASSVRKPGSIPLTFQTEVREGCPLDCGLCLEHKQLACLGIDAAQGRPVCNVTLNTNGIRLADDKAFAAALGQGNSRPGTRVTSSPNGKRARRPTVLAERRQHLPRRLVSAPRRSR
jgi:hypothetical protein